MTFQKLRCKLNLHQWGPKFRALKGKIWTSPEGYKRMRGWIVVTQTCLHCPATKEQREEL